MVRLSRFCFIFYVSRVMVHNAHAHVQRILNGMKCTYMKCTACCNAFHVSAFYACCLRVSHNSIKPRETRAGSEKKNFFGEKNTRILGLCFASQHEVHFMEVHYNTYKVSSWVHFSCKCISCHVEYSLAHTKCIACMCKHITRMEIVKRIAMHFV